MNKLVPNSSLYVDDVSERMKSTEDRIGLAATFGAEHIAARYRRGKTRVALQNELYVAILAIAAAAAEAAAAQVAGYKTFAELELWRDSREAMAEENCEEEVKPYEEEVEAAEKLATFETTHDFS
jgi:hypothetical protein